jgi:hypothetical protein
MNKLQNHFNYFKAIYYGNDPYLTSNNYKLTNVLTLFCNAYEFDKQKGASDNIFTQLVFKAFHQMGYKTSWDFIESPSEIEKLFNIIQKYIDNLAFV